MIILRKKSLQQPIKTLYHVTKIEYVDDILKNGLLISKYKSRPENEYFGIKETGLIYCCLNKNKLVKPVKPGKYVLLKIEVPLIEFDRMKKRFGDPEYDYFINTCKGNKERFLEENLKKYKLYYPDKWKDITLGELKNKSTDIEFGSPQNTICFKEDIPAKYISLA